jgi:hypothetical protein
MHSHVFTLFCRSRCAARACGTHFFLNLIMFPSQLRLNFILVYELLDEILDFGVPQGTSTELLKAFIFCEPQEVDASNALEQGLSALAKFSLGESKIKSATAAHKSVASRSSRNELFVDVLEVCTRCCLSEALCSCSAGSLCCARWQGKYSQSQY